MTKIRVVKENIDPSEVSPKDLTSDCMIVSREDGVFDLVRSYKMVDVFDTYHDLGLALKEIRICGGSLNPKYNDPRV